MAKSKLKEAAALVASASLGITAMPVTALAAVTEGDVAIESVVENEEIEEETLPQEETPAEEEQEDEEAPAAEEDEQEEEEEQKQEESEAGANRETKEQPAEEQQEEEEEVASAGVAPQAEDDAEAGTEDGVIRSLSGWEVIDMKAVVPEGTTHIPAHEFDGIPLIGISIPDSVVSIGEYAFANTANRNNNGVTMVGVKLPAGLQELGEGAFMNSGASSVNIPEGITEIKANTFKSSVLQSITFPDTLTTIGDSAFESTFVFFSLEFPHSLKHIGSKAFKGCYKFPGNITIPNSVEYVGDYAFDYSSLKTLVVEEGIAGDALAGEGIFSHCDVETVQLADSISSMGAKTFIECYDLHTVNIPAGMTTIPEACFQTCGSLVSVTIPSNIKMIGKSAFSYCRSLNSSNKGLREVIISEGVETIGDYAFSNNPHLVSLELPTSLRTIGYRSFLQCNSLPSVVIPEGVETIGNSAFSQCTKLASVSFPSTLTTIGDDAFFRDSLQRLYIPASVHKIGGSAFAQNDLEYIEFEDLYSQTDFWKNVFTGNPRLLKYSQVKYIHPLTLDKMVKRYGKLNWLDHSGAGVFPQLTGDYTISYLDTEGNSIAADEMLTTTATIANDYKNEKEIACYTPVGNAVVNHDDFTITCTYERAMVSYDVHYIDYKGASIADDATIQVPSGDEPDTEPLKQNIPGYRFNKVEVSGTDITLTYDKVDVWNISYVDYKNNQIATSVELELLNDKTPGEDIIKKQIPGYRFNRTEENGTDITVHYDKLCAWNIEWFTDKVVKTEKADTINDELPSYEVIDIKGWAYTDTVVNGNNIRLNYEKTATVVLSPVDAKVIWDGAKHSLTELASSNLPEGITLDEGDYTMTRADGQGKDAVDSGSYIYKVELTESGEAKLANYDVDLKTGTLVIEDLVVNHNISYVSYDNSKIAPDSSTKTINDEELDTDSITRPDFTGYRFNRIETVGNDVKLVYDKVDSHSVLHISNATNQEIAPAESFELVNDASLPAGEGEHKDIDGHRFSRTDIVEGGTIHYYDQVDDYYIHHISNKTGEDIIEPELVEIINDEKPDWEPQPKNLPGYRYSETIHSVGATHFYYDEVVDYTIRYIDEEGNEIGDDSTAEVVNGDFTELEKALEEKEFPGYRFQYYCEDEEAENTINAVYRRALPMEEAEEPKDDLEEEEHVSLVPLHPLYVDEDGNLLLDGGVNWMDAPDFLSDVDAADYREKFDAWVAAMKERFTREFDGYELMDASFDTNNLHITYTYRKTPAKIIEELKQEKQEKLAQTGDDAGTTAALTLAIGAAALLAAAGASRRRRD